MTNIHRNIAALGTLVALAAAIAAPAASAGTRPALRPHSTTTCSTITAAEIDKLIHVAVKAPGSNATGPITTCDYHGASSSVLIQYFQPFSSSSFASFVSEKTKAGEKATPLSGYGSKADAISVDGIPAGVLVLKGSSGLLVSTNSLSNEKTIAKYLVPKL